MAKERFLCVGETAVSAVDERGAGHGNHVYKVYNQAGPELLTVNFQNGPTQEKGVNGVQNEDLLMMVIDRLIGFQTGEYACEENETALRLIIQATTFLQLRTAKRKARGVEGTSEK